MSSESSAAVAPPAAQPMRWSRRILLVLGAAIGIPVVATVVHHFPPSEYHFYPPCIFNKFTGLHCPGCGGTRCVGALMRGDFEQAFAYNPLLILLLPLIAYGLWRSGYRSWTGRIAPGYIVPEWVLKVLVVVLAAYFIARNIPVYPFDLLAPHEIWR